MFVGAPLFRVQETNGKYSPRVEYRGGDPQRSPRLRIDHTTFGHSSFAASTMSRSRSREHRNRPSPSSPSSEPHKPVSDVVEIPNMLSAQGLDHGAVSFEHFLQLPLSDSLVQGAEAKLEEKRKQLLLDPEWLGLRAINMDHLISRLNELGELHAGIKEEQWESPDPWNGYKIEEMGEELFEKLLSSELGTTGAGTGSVTLKTQINALQRVLNTRDLWHDFSLVEWRIRLGQLLWANEDLDTRQLEESRQPRERDVLLLQITLAAELLLRLHALEALSSSVPPIVSQEDAQTLESQRGRKIQWDLLLAERFLDNINIAPKPPSESEKRANRNSYFSAITFFTARETDDDLEDSVQPLLTPKNEAEQLSGLVHFAESIRWPHAQDVKSELGTKLWKGTKERPVSTAASIYGTPLSSPKFPSSPGTRSSFFGSPDRQKRPGFARSKTSQSVLLFPARNIGGNVESFEVGGWLSKAWLSGFIMPGEAANHFLISALLENSPQAITALGEEANLYGGFVYESRSYWSKSCVVGRVLGASSDAAECMGWISVPESQAMEEGWIEVDVKQAPPTRSTLRIQDKEVVEIDSAPLIWQNLDSVQPDDFTRPTDGPLVMGNEVKCDGLSFSPANVSSEEDDHSLDATTPSTAHLTFSPSINTKLDKVTVPLTYDIHFVSSYPCHPKTNKSSSPSNPKLPSPPLSFEDKENESPTTDAKSKPQPTVDSKHPSKAPSTSTLNFSTFDKELPNPPTHPLHIDYTFDVLPVANLLSAPAEKRPRVLSIPEERKTLVTGVTGATEGVTVLDCRGTEDSELLARAWCAKVGENALIGKSGRTCLACCIREARALGMSIVIRL